MRKPHPPHHPYRSPEPAITLAAGSTFDACRVPLRAWFAANARDLPWRAPLEISQATGESPARGHAVHAVKRLRSSSFASAHVPLRSPYGVWVAEIMLQQTVVAAVISHYKRWMAEFPTVEALAAAAPENVLRAWAGLGYYARARNLHKGAQAVVQWRKERRSWPVTAEEWRTIPGVGEYTAGAIASLAFGERAPILDGNVVRVFSRLLGLGFLPGESAAAKKQYWELARLWIEDAAAASLNGQANGVPGQLNEGLMEVGALVCTPTSPRCEICPLRDSCAARRHGWGAQLPPPKPRVKPSVVAAVALVVTARDGVLMETRAAGGFLAGHELFPLFLGPEAATWNESFAERYSGVSLRTPQRVATLRHTIMTTRYEVEVWRATLIGVKRERPNNPVVSTTSKKLLKSEGQNPALRKVPLSQLEGVLTNALSRKIWDAVVRKSEM